jgi:hypothetical protein
MSDLDAVLWWIGAFHMAVYLIAGTVVVTVYLLWQVLEWVYRHYGLGKDFLAFLRARHRERYPPA